MRTCKLAATQMPCSWDVEANLDRAESLVRAAAAAGAEVVLLQELFATPYFCIDQDPRHFALAEEAGSSRLVARFASVAREVGVVLPLSYYERSSQVYFNSLTMIDADGTDLGLYRKTHIPQGPGYQEKFYFSPGDTGFRVWDTAAGRLGAAVCWDQWFPECARVMALRGAEVLLYPTAIGSEPSDPTMDTSGAWQRVMQGHSAANGVPVVASNRIGTEEGAGCSITFYGHSFVTDGGGALAAEAVEPTEGFVMAEVDLDALRDARAFFGLYRDRRPEMYADLLRLDG